MTLAQFYLKFYFKILNVLKVVVIAFLAVMAFLLTFLAVDDKFEFTGYKVFVVETGSMLPAIPIDTLVLVESRENYEVDDVIAFRNTKEDVVIVHRIYENTDDGLLTKGDNNTFVDTEIVTTQNIIGEVVWINGPLGIFMQFARSTLGIILLMVIPITVLLTLQSTQVYGWIKGKVEGVATKV